MEVGKGARVWIENQENVWVTGIVVNKSSELIVVQEDNGLQLTLKKIPLLCNPDILLGANDLTTLSHLHEPAVLQSLQIRYKDAATIYTYCGIVLVAINPFEALPIYGNEIIKAYNHNNIRDMDPHVYAVAEESYQLMNRGCGNQSVIVSGESGSGKTVNAKYALRYFASLNREFGDTDIENKILLSNPILEALGNAKTTRNDNSSRFGKYIEVNFSKEFGILGGRIRTYLLEKTRVVKQSSEERNYHIFYQFLASRNMPEFQQFRLESSDNFYYTNQGNCLTISGVDDFTEFQELLIALNHLGFDNLFQSQMFKLLAAILHLGNIKIQGKDGEESSFVVNAANLSYISTLLGVSDSSLSQWLCNKKINTAHEVLIKPLTVAQAVISRDSLAKHLYNQFFQLVVDHINLSLQSSVSSNSFIGVLDIYGFEIFKWNSFEQFCINYANEKLQQQFNMHVFKLEQQEYVSEGITWSFIDYYDNQPCIDIIEGHLGVLDLLDETCKMPSCSDTMFIQKLYEQILKKGHSHFSKPRTSRTSFCIHHYADIVTYQVETFTEKNIDLLSLEYLHLLQSSKEEFIAKLFDVNEIVIKKGKGNKSSVGFKFRESLSDLMSTLNQTTPHYIRCIKPNDVKSPFVFNRSRVVEQLRACGILETIRISAAGFPSRCTYKDFFDRYWMLLPWQQLRRDDRALMCEYILKKCVKDSEQYRLGNTKIFFRAGQVAYLEHMRNRLLHQCCLTIQTYFRMWIQKKKYSKICYVAKVLQCFIRGHLVRRMAQTIRENKATVVIQSYYKMYKIRKRYLKLKKTALYIQSIFRGIKARQLAQSIRQFRAAVLLQAIWRGILGRRFVSKRKAMIIKVQCTVRKWFAKRQLKALKIEAKSVDHLQSLNKGLEIKIIELQQKLIQEEVKNAQLMEANEELRAKCKELTNVGQNHNELILKEIDELSNELGNEKSRSKQLEEDRDQIMKKQKETDELHQKEIAICNEHCEQLNLRLEETLKQLNMYPSIDEWNTLKHEHALLNLHHQNSVQKSLSRANSLYRNPSIDQQEEYTSFYDKTPSTILESNSFNRTHSIISSVSCPVPLEIQEWNISETESLTTYDTKTDSNEKRASLMESFQLQINKLTEENMKLRKKLDIYERRTSIKENMTLIALSPSDKNTAVKVYQSRSPKPILGMLSWQISDLPKIMKILIIESNHELIDESIPCAEAHLLFMCLRYADHCGSVDLMSQLIENLIISLQLITQNHKDNLYMLSYWLANVVCFLNNLRQYSGNQVYDNPMKLVYKDSQTSLTSFELSEYHHIIIDEAIVIYHSIVQLMEKRLHGMIVPGLIEHAAIPGISDVRPVGWLKVLKNISKSATVSANDIEKELSSMFQVLESCHLELNVIGQIFKQLFYIINASMLNYLLLRKDMCHWSCGMQIRYNLNIVEEWVREHGLVSYGLLECIQPVVQATKLLQMKKKTEDDAKTICDVCTTLNTLQIQKLLTMYTPRDGYEERVPGLVIRYVAHNGSHTNSSDLMTNPMYTFPVEFPYSPTDIDLATIAVPEKLNFLLKI